MCEKYKLKPECDYVTSGEDLEETQPLEWWVFKYSQMIEPYLNKCENEPCETCGSTQLMCSCYTVIPEKLESPE